MMVQQKEHCTDVGVFIQSHSQGRWNSLPAFLPLFSPNFHMALFLTNCVQIPRYLYIKMTCPSPQTSETETGKQTDSIVWFPWIELFHLKNNGEEGSESEWAGQSLQSFVYMLLFLTFPDK